MECFSAGRVITIKECMEIALQNHPDLQISEESWKKAIADYRVVKGKRGLQINAQIYTQEFNRSNVSDTSIAGKDTDIGLVFGVGASYNLFNYKAIKEEQAARTALDLSKISQLETKDTIILTVKKAYYNFLSCQENMLLRKQLHESNKSKLDLVRKLFKSGQRPILDVSKAEIGYAEALLDYEKAKNNYRSARIQLYMAMGIKNIGTDIVPEDIDNLPQLKYSEKELFKLAESYNYNLQTIKISREVDKLKIEIERAQRYPDISLLLGLAYRNTAVYQNDSFKGFVDEENWELKVAPSIKISLPLYTSGVITSRVDAAMSNYNQTIYKERQIRMNLDNQILDSVKTLEELQKQIEMSKLIIENAKKNLLMADKSYESGSTSLLDLQDAQMRVISAEIGYINSKYQYLLTIAQLANTIGLEEEFLCEKK